MKDDIQTFKKSVKSFDASLIPPCKAELLQQLKRVTFVSNNANNVQCTFATYT